MDPRLDIGFGYSLGGRFPSDSALVEKVQVASDIDELGKEILPLAIHLKHLVVIGKPRWGNQIVRLLNAIQFALEFGVPEIRIEHLTGFPMSFRYRGITVLQKRETPNAFFLSGPFFSENLIGVTRLQPPTRFAILNELRSQFGLKKTGSFQTRDSLVIHIRSGDIYRKRRPHPDYGQPPLSFYKLVVNRKKPNFVTVLTEDELSPVLSGLCRFLGAKKIPFEVSGIDLEGTMSQILWSTSLVSAKGTFSAPLVCMSETLREVFFFDDIGLTEKWGVPQGQIELIGAKEKSGFYKHLVLAPWKNSPIQRQLIRRWPGFLLSLEVANGE